MLNFLILIIMTEHLIVLIKFIMMSVIGSTPVWVQKQLVKVNNITEQFIIKEQQDEAKR